MLGPVGQLAHKAPRVWRTVEGERKACYDASMTDTKGKNNGARILPCSCKDAGPLGQDAIHGNGHRVHNGCKDGWRCTVCGTKK